MTARKKVKGSRPRKSKAAGATPSATGKASKVLQLPPGQPDTGQPGSGKGRVDVTGIMPEGIRVDPDITEGHPGYEESGGSEIIPAERFSGQQTREGKRSRG